MKITTLDPMIITPKAEEVIKLFEALGFAKTHAPSVNIEIGEVTDVRLKHPEGYHVDVAGVDKLPKDMTIIRMNVDNFEEAYDLLISRGFKNNRGDGLVETASAKSATMISPSGFTNPYNNLPRTKGYLLVGKGTSRLRCVLPHQ